jgi:hypothetical protein
MAGSEPQEDEPQEVFAKYAEVLREANQVLLAGASLSEAERSGLGERLADPGWWETPPRVPEGLPISDVVWIKARPVDDQGRRLNFVDSTYYDELGADEPGATAGLHELGGNEYIVVYQESGPQWLAAICSPRPEALHSSSSFCRRRSPRR